MESEQPGGSKVMLKIRLLAIILMSTFLMGILPAAGAEDIESIRIPSARDAALGGRHVALADDTGTLFSNPAGFRTAEPGFAITSIGVELSGPIFDMTSLLLSGSSPDLASADVQDLMRNLYAGLNLPGPVSATHPL